MYNLQLFDKHGRRKYLTPSERKKFEDATAFTDELTRTFCLMILLTGCRISEALNLKIYHIDYEAQTVIFETLKQRRKGVFRQVPLPSHFLETLRHTFAIACLDKGIPLNMVQKWMGHTSITTTAIYANATGEEERKIAERLWT